ncbi:cyclic nucleotide-binding domain protein [Gregarina niphandrodes]|uniref:Cyclic nucleotide-binding domain protein n=1 Tax=Gregarina niphandrodes TaxID=110365 RepID=A0A023B7W7_GRENI|nr:cyclic nucleotide-binding domain protein [Gregarina niphandrodes]EZG68104.1 cyclic nucleotide-binding domain protein [Gregarina niphandrodes]|eukprot:XP_011130089.1 cyclic nucleotide-binding domain protein [Gregarina niphandrodes]
MAETTLRETLGLIARVIWESGLSDRASIWELVVLTAQDQLVAIKEAPQLEVATSGKTDHPLTEHPLADHTADHTVPEYAVADPAVAGHAVADEDRKEQPAVPLQDGDHSVADDTGTNQGLEGVTDGRTREAQEDPVPHNRTREPTGMNLVERAPDLERGPNGLESAPDDLKRASGIVFSGVDSQLKSGVTEGGVCETGVCSTANHTVRVGSHQSGPNKGAVIQFAAMGSNESFVLYSLMKRYFLMTCNDLFNAAECHKRAPWSMGPYINECRDKALRRCYNIRKMVDDLSCPITAKARCDDSSSTAAEESDYSDSGLILPDRTRMRMGPRTPVRAEDVDFAPLPSYSKTPEEIAVISATLDAGTSFVFEAIRDQEDRKKKLVDALKPVTIPAGSFAIRNGDTGDGMYFIGVGKFSVLRGDQEIKQLGPGDIFGELAVLHQSTRTYSCKALEDSTVYFLHRSSYIALIRSNQ